jgi:hypothetical protein
MKRRTTMKGLVFVKVAGLFIAAMLLASCYAPLANQNGYLSLDLKFAGARGAATNEVIGLVVNGDYESSFREMLWLVDKGEHGGLTSTQADRLLELGKLMATNGLVKFGGFPFFDTTIDPTSPGSFELTGIPAGRSYFVKLFVFDVGHSFKVEDIDEHFEDHVQTENLIFGTEDSTFAFDSVNWNPVIGQPLEVKAGESSPITISLP